MFLYETCIKIKFAMPWYRNFSKHIQGFCVSLCEQWYFINMGDVMIYIMWDIFLKDFLFLYKKVVYCSCKKTLLISTHIENYFTY